MKIPNPNLKTPKSQFQTAQKSENPKLPYTPLLIGGRLECNYANSISSTGVPFCPVRFLVFLHKSVPIIKE